MVFGASFTPKNCHVGDVRRTRFEVVYSCRSSKKATILNLSEMKEVL